MEINPHDLMWTQWLLHVMWRLKLYDQEIDTSFGDDKESVDLAFQLAVQQDVVEYLQRRVMREVHRTQR